MSTLAEIEAAVMALPTREQRALFDLLARRLEHAPKPPGSVGDGLKAASRPALEGLPVDLSVGTRERLRSLVAKRHAANR